LQEGSWAANASGFNLMKPKARRCKCLHCKQLFVPDYRNRGRQKYCSSPECQQASKRARQQRWLNKPENRDHWRGSENVQRVQEWRQAHPGYWRCYQRPTHQSVGTLQDACSEQVPAAQELKPELAAGALQDVCSAQLPLLVGLISKFTDCTLQDDIALFIRRLVAKGQDILEQPSRRSLKGNTVYDEQKDPASGAVAASAGAV
jgi:hypothetical protein